MFNKDKTSIIVYPAAKSDSEYTIPDTVTTIGSECFNNNKSLTKVTFGENVKTVEDSAFYKCSSIKTVATNAKLNKIERDAFGYCYSLETIDLTSVTYIGSHAFINCTSLTAVKLGASIKFIGGSTFESDINLKTITVADTITNFEANAYRGNGWDNYIETYKVVCTDGTIEKSALNKYDGDNPKSESEAEYNYHRFEMENS